MTPKWLQQLQKKRKIKKQKKLIRALQRPASNSTRKI